MAEKLFDYVIAYTEDEGDVKIAENALWCSVIERLVFDLRAPVSHPLRIRQRAIRDFLLNDGHIREILEERCGFTRSLAADYFQKLEKLVKASEADLESEAPSVKVPNRFWWAKRLVQ